MAVLQFTLELLLVSFHESSISTMVPVFIFLEGQQL